MTRAGPARQDEPMAAQFDTLVAAEALHDAGIDEKHAKAIATQLRIASDAGEPVTRPELQAALAPLATRAELEAGLAALKTDLIDRIAETERRVTEHTTSLLWRFFGAMVAVVTAAIAVLEYLRTPAG